MFARRKLQKLHVIEYRSPTLFVLSRERKRSKKYIVFQAT